MARWTNLFEPFEILRRSNQESSGKEKENGGRDSTWKCGSSSGVVEYREKKLQDPILGEATAFWMCRLPAQAAHRNGDPRAEV